MATASWHDTAHVDMDWATERIAVGGGIFSFAAMAEVAAAGVTHILSVGDFDESELAAPHGVAVLHAHVEDNFEPKDAAWFERGVNFAKAALRDVNAKLYIHCAAGIHRGPLMALAVMCSTGWSIEAAMRLIKRRRPQVDFPEVYLDSVRTYLQLAAPSDEASAALSYAGGGAVTGDRGAKE